LSELGLLAIHFGAWLRCGSPESMTLDDPNTKRFPVEFFLPGECITVVIYAATARETCVSMVDNGMEVIPSTKPPRAWHACVRNTEKNMLVQRDNLKTEIQGQCTERQKKEKEKKGGGAKS
jgi:hypothetical protein